MIELLKTYYRRFRNRKVSYAQTGEDILADFFLFNQKKGFYVDIGANDPVFLSNTYYFYKKGWQGICVEPSVFRAKLIKRSRPRDIVVNSGIAEQKGKMDFYVLYPDTLSTFSKEEADANIKGGYKLEEVKQVEVMSLKELFERYLGNNEIDLLSTDTEGTDLSVLKSNDWQKYRPKIIIAEIVDHKGGHSVRHESQISEFLYSQGYKKLADTYINGIYIEADFAAKHHLGF